MLQPAQLDVFWGDTPAGAIHDTAPLTFEYAASWLAQPQPRAIAVIPLQAGRIDSAAVQAFFENLLPEGELRHYIASQKKASTLFSLLLAVAGDTAGGFVILPGGKTPAPARYEATSWQQLAARLGQQTAAASDIKGRGARISLAGAQDKTSIALFADGVPRLPAGTSPATHIVKPDIKRLSKVWHSAANEAIIMRTAALCGLPAAEVFYEPLTRSCVVRRFDRVLRADGKLERLIQYDLCQLAGIVSDKKYESEGGPGIAACAELIREHSAQPAVDLRHFAEWIFFNLYTGNNDSHAKNLSMLEVPGQGLVLAPFYDLMCTRLYPGLAADFAFAIGGVNGVGGETRPGSVAREHVAALAGQLRMRRQFVFKLAGDLAARLPAAIEAAVAPLLPALPHGAKIMAGRLKQFVLSTANKSAARIRR